MSGSARPGWIVAGMALALAVWLGWRLYGPGGHGDPVATSLVALQRADRLTVFSAQLSPVVSADDVRGFGLLRSHQVAVIPARVDYSVELAGLGAERLAWDSATQRLTVRLPGVRASAPDLDEGHAQYLKEGVWITAEAEQHLTHDNTLEAQAQAAKAAANPVLLDLARQAARAALSANLAAPLHAAGYAQATVAVRFDGEKDAP